MARTAQNTIKVTLPDNEGNVKLSLNLNKELYLKIFTESFTTGKTVDQIIQEKLSK